MPRKPRRSFSPEERAGILRRHHVDKVPVAKVCEDAAQALAPDTSPRVKALGSPTRRRTWRRDVHAASNTNNRLLPQPRGGS
jgi:hypothetical protein